uniref:Uncharacterized protein n=1 Tax=viral metagenome TaxID=1070528 RepID=A0A6C0CN17_9ZZZZ
MKFETKLWVIMLLIIFVLGIFVCLHPMFTREQMINMMNGEHLEKVDTPACPNMLIKSGSTLTLFNTRMPRSETNPLYFDNLDAYLEYIQKQRVQGIRCPVLFLQEENNTQGQTVYRMRPSMNNLNPGVPIEPVEVADGSRDRPPYNKNQFAGFDSHGQHVGQYTELDQIHDSTKSSKISDNPMDPNWGGVTFSRKVVESGKYDDRIVGKPTMVPKVMELYK